MKAILVVILTLAAHSAFAAIQLPGSFLPRECGTQEYLAGNAATLALEGVCIGSIVGSPSQGYRFDAVRFELSSHTTQIFKVKNVVPVHGRRTTSVTDFMYELENQDRETITLMVTVDMNGQVNLAGRIGRIDFVVGNFESVFTTMGLVQQQDPFELQ